MGNRNASSTVHQAYASASSFNCVSVRSARQA
jgi:hypothetical protein